MNLRIILTCPLACKVLPIRHGLSVCTGRESGASMWTAARVAPPRRRAVFRRTCVRLILYHRPRKATGPARQNGGRGRLLRLGKRAADAAHPVGRGWRRSERQEGCGGTPNGGAGCGGAPNGGRSGCGGAPNGGGRVRRRSERRGRARRRSERRKGRIHGIVTFLKQGLLDFAPRRRYPVHSG